MDLPYDDDPIVAEVRRIREEIAARFDYDSGRIAEYVRQSARETWAEWNAKRQRELGECAVQSPPWIRP
jgi:hypothetical protein